jgi:hypothetical protein
LKRRTFYVEARIGLSIGVEISATSLDDAIEKAKNMKLDQFVEVLGDHNDSNFAISGVFTGGGAPEL